MAGLGGTSLARAGFGGPWVARVGQGCPRPLPHMKSEGKTCARDFLRCMFSMCERTTTSMRCCSGPLLVGYDHLHRMHDVLPKNPFRPCSSLEEGRLRKPSVDSRFVVKVLDNVTQRDGRRNELSILRLKLIGISGECLG